MSLAKSLKRSSLESSTRGTVKELDKLPAKKVFSAPETDYTKALMAAAFELETV